jgi:4-carboxymuconolactone decarboxylase
LGHIVDYLERLRRLAISDDRLTELDSREFLFDRDELVVDPKALALARIAALVAMGGAEPSFGSLVDAAVGAGATAGEIVDVLVGITAVVGVPRVVAAAPLLAMALGHDLEENAAGGGAVDWHA